MGAPVARAVTFKLQPRKQTSGLRNRGGFFFPEPPENERPDSQLSRRGSHGNIRVDARENLATSGQWWIFRQGAVASISSGRASVSRASDAASACERYSDNRRDCNHGDRGALLG